MKIALRHILMLALLFTASALGTLRAANPTAPSFAGTWQGTLDAGTVKLRIVFEIKTVEGGGLTGTMDSPDQRAFGLKLDTVKQEGANVTAALNAIDGTYNGTFSPDGSQIVGTWAQRGYSVPLTLQRGEKVAPAKRAQEPVPPMPYQAGNVETPRDVHRPALAFAGSLDMQTPQRQSFRAVSRP